MSDGGKCMGGDGEGGWVTVVTASGDTFYRLISSINPKRKKKTTYTLLPARSLETQKGISFLFYRQALSRASSLAIARHF